MVQVSLSLSPHPPFRVIKPEEGKKLADSWGAAFMESSAKENQVIFWLFKHI